MSSGNRPSRDPEIDRLRHLLARAQRLLVWATPAAEETEWWAEVEDVLGGDS